MRSATMLPYVLSLLLAHDVVIAQKPDSITLKTIVIQANRADAHNPVPHTNLSAAQIAKQYHAQDVPYLLSGVPSLVESSDAGAGVGYTAMRIRGSDPTRINVSINGIPLNDAESQGVFWVNLPDLAASAAEIQVQRGVGGSTNGAGAFGATVNLDLSNVAPNAFLNLTNAVGSFATRRHSVQFGTGLLKNRFAFSGRVSQIQSDGYVDRASANLRSAHFSGAYIGEKQSLQLHALLGHERTYQAWYGLPAQYLNNEKLRTYNVAGTERPDTPYPDEVDNYGQNHFLLHYKRIVNHELSLQLNGHYTRGKGYFEQYKADQDYIAYGLASKIIDTQPPPADLVRRRWLDNHFYGATFALRWAPAHKWLATLGGAASRYDGAHFGEIIWTELPTGQKPDFRYYDNDATKRDANLFLKIETKVKKGLTSMLDLQVRGVQYDFLGFDNDQNNVTQRDNLLFFNPKAGFNWQFSPRWAWNFFFGVGHREPNRDDYTQSTPQSRPKAERLYNLETNVGIRRDIWQFSANMFFMGYRNQLVLDGRINDVGAYIRTNVPESYRAGVELEGQLMPLPNLTIRGNAAFSRNKVHQMTAFIDNWDNPDQQFTTYYRQTDLAFSPRLVARVEAEWTALKMRRHTLSSTLICKRVGEQYIDNSQSEAARLAPWQLWDIRLNHEMSLNSRNRLNLILTIANILDRQYVANGWIYRYYSATYDARADNPYTRLEEGSLYNQTGYFPQAGRNVMLTAVWKFGR